VNYTEEGMQIVQGTDAGFIKFGSRVDLFYLLNSIDVVIKKQLRKTIIAQRIMNEKLDTRFQEAVDIASK
jgi:phosphatidylserine decarboxylase